MIQKRYRIHYRNGYIDIFFRRPYFEKKVTSYMIKNEYKIHYRKGYIHIKNVLNRSKTSTTKLKINMFSGGPILKNGYKLHKSLHFGKPLQKR